MQNTRILIFGLDGGTWSLLRPLAEEGYMPNLARWMRQGAFGVLNSTKPPITPAAWGSFQTGQNPGRSGVFDFSSFDLVAHRLRIVTSQSLGKTVWEYASESGRSVLALNVPLTYPPRPIHGCIVSGLLTPSLDSSFIYPESWRDGFLRAMPDYHIFNIFTLREEARYHFVDAFIEEMAATIEMRARAARYLLGRGIFDLAMVHFQAPDVVQHPLWAYLDETSPNYQPEIRKSVAEQFYHRLDGNLGHLYHEFVAQDLHSPILLVLISDHGFQLHHTRVNLGNWLLERGYMRMTHGSQSQQLLTALLDLVGRLDVLNVRRRLVPREHRIRARQTIHEPDWGHSRAYVTGRSSWGFVYLLGDAKTREATEQALISDLQALRDPRTDRTVIQNIHRRDEIYHGPYLDKMPHLLLVPQPGYTFTGQVLPGRGLWDRVEPGKDFHSGVHHPKGIYLFVGEGIQANSNGPQADIEDIMPTLLYALGEPIPRHLDGQPLLHVFTEGFRSQQSLRRRTEDMSETARTPSAPQHLSPDEEAAIKQRLSDLGYLE